MHNCMRHRTFHLGNRYLLKSKSYVCSKVRNSLYQQQFIGLHKILIRTMNISSVLVVLSTRLTLNYNYQGDTLLYCKKGPEILQEVAIQLDQPRVRKWYCGIGTQNVKPDNIPVSHSFCALRILICLLPIKW